jgi:type I restriction enzyme S subunit
LSVYLGRGVIPFSAVAEKRTNPTSDDLSRYQAVEPGDFVLNNQQAWRGSVGISRYNGIVSPAYLVLILNGRLDQEFADRLFSDRGMVTQYLVSSRGVGSIQRNLYWPHLKRVATLVPPASEQAAIVRFLDHADARTRRCIVAKQKLIKLLGEEKQAIIHRAVTRGLDPNVRLKPSSVEWLGQIPEHWDVRRVKQISHILRGKFTHRPRNDPSLYDGPYPFIQTGEVARAGKSITSYRQTLNERGLAVSKMFPVGTLVMTIAANIGDVAILDFDACFPHSVVGFVPNTNVTREYLYYVFRAMKPELLRKAPVNTQGNLNVDRIGSRRIALPPVIEQHAIVLQIEEQTLGLNAMTDRIENEIALLREYRTRLIADVVTGKLDVCEAAA